jgi:hypothetical protein
MELLTTRSRHSDSYRFREVVMTAVTTRGEAPVAVPSGTRRRKRVVAVAAAALAPLVVYVVALVAGVHLQTPSQGGALQDLAAVTVVVTGVVVGLAAWALLAVLERFTRRARGLWTGVAVGVFVLSLVPPLGSPGLTGAQRAALAGMHIAVAVTLIPLLRRSAKTAASNV